MTEEEPSSGGTEEVDLVLDTSGSNCPVPIIKTSKTMKKMESGTVLKLISTDPASVADMKSWTKRTGNPLLDTIEENGKYIFLVRKK